MNVVHGTILSSVNYDIKFSINMHGTSTKGKIVEVYHSGMNVVNKTMNAAERSTCMHGTSTKGIFL
jgi:hypothetical protein